MRRFFLVVGPWFLVLGCAHDNPSFSAEDGVATEGRGVSTSGGRPSVADEGSVSATSTGDSGTTQGTLSLATSESDLDEGPDSSTSDACVVEPHPALPIEVTIPRAGGQGPADCLHYESMFGLLEVRSGVISVGLCGEAECNQSCGSLESASVDFGGLAEGWIVPECGKLHVWGSPGNGGCEWEGAAIVGRDQSGVFVASNTNEAFGPILGGQVVTMVGPLECEGEGDNCASKAGHYGLQFASVDTVIRPQDAPLSVSFGLPGRPPATGEFRNHRSRVTESCEQQVSWSFRSQE
ncbi:MAG: hypothetical protein JKY37_18645 [Nannocystaceae bacterium]|nr:hypothetical protein [Nannocystaceae bacterium]